MPNDANSRNVVYAPIFAAPSTSPHLYAAWAGGTQGGSNLVWRADITNEFLGSRPSGSLSSPTVLSDGRVVMPSDDGVMYDFAAQAPANPDNPPYLFLPRPYGTEQTERPPGDFYYSTTAVLGPGGSYLLTGEDSSDLVIYEFGIAVERARHHVEVGGAWVFGAFAGDGADRVMAVTRGSCGNQHARRLHGMQLTRDVSGAWNEFDIDRSWKYPRYLDSSTCIPPIFTPPCNPYIYNRAAERMYAPPAMDIDGSVVCVTPTIIFAVRPLRGDFNGDGCRNNFDIDALALALTDPYWWEHTDANYPSETGFGERKGVNLLGVGDVNNDRAFNNFDLDPWISLILADSRCACTGWDDNQGGDGFSAPTANSGAGDATDDDWGHFWDVVGQLQERFGSY
ncbi:MAG: hypothetical protein JNG88_18470 [Phycisphaerales bacterium]|nr:hypothetical protein [Phycisphaerales bacterium]